MRKIFPLALFLVFVFSFLAQAQLPGDFNCSGEITGLDVTYYWHQVRNCILIPIDTATCYWRNGDLNSDGLFTNVADERQLYYYFMEHPSVDIPPQPAYLDSINIGDVWGLPGDSVLMPLEINIAENMGAFEIQIHYFNRYLINPDLVTAQLFDSNYVFINDTTAYYFNNHRDSLPSGRYEIGNLKFTIAADTPLDTILAVSLVGGWYFPTGFANYSYPTHFITPIMINGVVHVGTSGVDEANIPINFGLRTYPNPFNAQTTIEYDLPTSANITLSIFDITGRKIETLLDGYQNAGSHQIIWNAHDYSSGVYFYRIQTGNLNQTKRALLLK